MCPARLSVSGLLSNKLTLWYSGRAFRPEADTTLAHGFSHGTAYTTSSKGRRPTQFLFVKPQQWLAPARAHGTEIATTILVPKGRQDPTQPIHVTPSGFVFVLISLTTGLHPWLQHAVPSGLTQLRSESAATKWRHAVAMGADLERSVQSIVPGCYGKEALEDCDFDAAKVDSGLPGKREFQKAASC